MQRCWPGRRRCSRVCMSIAGARCFWGGSRREGDAAMALTQTAFIPVPAGAEPGFDHADCYRGKRVYVAHTGADRIDVIDIAERCHLRSLDGLSGVAGVLIDQEQDLLFSSDRGCARISVWRCSDEEPIARVGVGAHPNGLAYDPQRRRLYVFNLGDPPGHAPTLTVVDLVA